jgi:hypothetical protein
MTVAQKVLDRLEVKSVSLLTFAQVLTLRIPDKLLSTESKELIRHHATHTCRYDIRSKYVYKIGELANHIKAETVTFVGVVRKISRQEDKYQIDFESVDDCSWICCYIRSTGILTEMIKPYVVVLVTNAERKVSKSCDIYVQTQHSNLHVIGAVKEQIVGFQAN